MGAKKHLVLIGGGHTHALLLKQWAESPVANVKVSVINPGERAAYSGMLPGYIAGHYALTELQLNIAALAKESNADFVQDSAVGINLQHQSIQLSSGRELNYDVASIDIGITTGLKDIKGFVEHGVAAKPLDHFANCWQQFRIDLQQGNKKPKVAIVGGGVAGAELALAIAHTLRDAPEATINLIDRSDILSEMHPRTRRIVLRKFEAYGIRLHSHTAVLEVEKDQLRTLKNNNEEGILPTSFTLSAAGARPYEWLKGIGNDAFEFKLHDGFINVDAYLRSTNPKIYAVGDCAHMAASPRSKAGVYAVRQAPFLYQNLVAALQEKPDKLKAYQPQGDYLKLMSLGSKQAVADKLGLQVSGKWVWRLKNRIDQAFMRQFNE